MNTQKHITIILVYFSIISGFLLIGCNEQQITTPDKFANQKPVDNDMVLDNLAPSEASLQQLYFSDEIRHKVVGNIVHYKFKVRVGPGPYDVVGIHRVVRESQPYEPLPTRGNIFMVHGIIQDFEDIYFYAGVDEPTKDTSLPIYLASKGIDVWGIDLAWTLVPEETSDFEFMRDWDIEREVDHLLAAMSVARHIRKITGQGNDRMNLFGFSYSGIITYAAAGRESQQPYNERDIGSIIPVENGLNVEDEHRKQLACDNVEKHYQLIESGNLYTSNNGLRLLYQLATNDPEGTSPLPPYSHLTNYQAALQASMASSFWHFVGVDFNMDDIPVGLLYSDPDRWIDLLGGSPPYTTYMPRLLSAEVAKVRCGMEVSFDDYLADISIPILYIGAGGAYGEEEGYWTTKLTSSDDITIYEVSLQPESNRDIDFGHADLFIANDASKLMWKQLKQWLYKHSNKSHIRARNKVVERVK